MAGAQHMVVEVLTNSQCACQPGSGWHAASVCQHVRLSDRVSSALQQSSRSRVSATRRYGISCSWGTHDSTQHPCAVFIQSDVVVGIVGLH